MTDNFTFTFHFHALEKEMATHSSVLAWRIPGTGEPGRLPSLGLHRVGYDWSDLAAAAAYIGTTQSSLWPSEYVVMHVSSAINDLSCYIVIIYKPGVRESEHAILANLLSPHTGLLKLNLLGKSSANFSPWWILHSIFHKSCISLYPQLPCVNMPFPQKHTLF